MLGLRVRLGRLAGAWLIAQLCLVASVPTAVCLGMPNAAHAAECTCDHGDGQMCPMHHRPAAPTSKTCSCRSTTDPMAVITAALWGPIAVLPSPAGFAAPPIQSSLLSSISPRADEAILLPDAPPPRA